MEMFEYEDDDEDEDDCGETSRQFQSVRLLGSPVLIVAGDGPGEEKMS